MVEGKEKESSDGCSELHDIAVVVELVAGWKL